MNMSSNIFAALTVESTPTTPNSSQHSSQDNSQYAPGTRIQPGQAPGDHDEKMTSPSNSPENGRVLVPSTPINGNIPTTMASADADADAEGEDDDSIHDWDHTPTSHSSRFLQQISQERTREKSPSPANPSPNGGTFLIRPDGTPAIRAPRTQPGTPRTPTRRSQGPLSQHGPLRTTTVESPQTPSRPPGLPSPFLTPRQNAPNASNAPTPRPIVSSTPAINQVHPPNAEAGPSGTTHPPEQANPFITAGVKRKLTDEERAKRTAAIEKGLEDRVEEVRRITKEKGKQVPRRPIARLPNFTRIPSRHAPPEQPSPSVNMPVTKEYLLAIDEMERIALGPQAKKARTEGYHTPRPTAHRPTNEKAANSFPRPIRMDKNRAPRKINDNHYQRIAALQANRDNVTGDPKLHLTPPPPNKQFDMVEGNGPHALWENITDWIRGDWEDLEINKALLQVFGMSAHPSHPRHDAVMDQLPILLNAMFETEGINLSRPCHDPSYKLEPNTFMLWGMDDDTLNTLIAYRVFSTPQYQFFIYPFDPEFPDFMCTLENFSPSLLINKGADDTILSIIRKTLRSPEHIDRVTNVALDATADAIADAIADAEESGEDVAETQEVTADDLIDAIWIKIKPELTAGNIAKPIVNVYSPPPSS
ncbi:hypothetical protein QCA50_004822 [Cerrena zonata]|uniref:Uncharacterized protein n=1 Tax=Cerrena zonata TaxID=2478898 RepID=A0AAW0GDA5_9APHY